jgi:hypothetical protein
MLGYGRFIIQSSQGRSIIDYVPYPEQLYLEIVALVFPGKISCPDCGGQGVRTERNNDGGMSTSLCLMCRGRRKI